MEIKALQNKFSERASERSRDITGRFVKSLHDSDKMLSSTDKRGSRHQVGSRWLDSCYNDRDRDRSVGRSVGQSVIDRSPLLTVVLQYVP